MHISTVNEMCECLEELYSCSSNLHKAYDMVEELL